jgi:hypothetical protein
MGTPTSQNSATVFHQVSDIFQDMEEVNKKTYHRIMFDRPNQKKKFMTCPRDKGEGAIRSKVGACGKPTPSNGWESGKDSFK